jgi:hypothetical protein
MSALGGSRHKAKKAELAALLLAAHSFLTIFNALLASRLALRRRGSAEG